MSIKNSIPNFVTCCSLISGCIACIMALRGNLPMATLWIVIAAVFDFGDGFAARSLHAYSLMGKELDSLSDMVSFGVAPGMIVYWLLEQACMTAPVLGEAAGYVPYMALVIPVFSGLRLAKFNIGYAFHSAVPVDSIGFIAGTIVAAILFSSLLVSEVPMFSLKVKSLAWKGNELRYILVAGAVVFVTLFGVLGIAGTVILYITLSFFNKRR